MAVAAEAVSGLIGELYAAALDPTDRQSIATRFAAAFEASNCLVFTRDPKAKSIKIASHTDNFTPQFAHKYNYEYHLQDIWAQGGYRLGSKRAFLGEEIITETALMRTGIYWDVMRPMGLQYMMGGISALSPTLDGVVGITRGRTERPYDAEALTTMNLLLPHLCQALGFSARFTELENGRRIGMAALSALSVGAIVTTRDRRVKLVNAAAERLVRTHPGLALRQNRLALSDPALDGKLGAAIDAAALAPFGRYEQPGFVLVVPAAEGPDLSLTVSPLHPDAMPAAPLEPMAIVFLSNRSVSQPLPALLAAVYGLTLAETRIALALADGQRLADYAATANIAMDTAKTQLKQVFAKTGCHRQADLIRLMMSDPVLRLASVDLKSNQLPSRE